MISHKSRFRSVLMAVAVMSLAMSASAHEPMQVAYANAPSWKAPAAASAPAHEAPLMVAAEPSSASPVLGSPSATVVSVFIAIAIAATGNLIPKRPREKPRL